jgi:hypothetical protein
MGDVTARDDESAGSSDYWRRRFVVLAAGLTGLFVVAWVISAALRAGPPPPHRSVVTREAAARGATPGSTHRAAAPSRSAAAPGTPAASAPPASSRHPAIKPAFCARPAIVLSLTATQTRFTAGQAPTFSVGVVSTQRAACSFNVGPAHLAVVIREGTARIWGSSDCTRGNGDLITALTRGVPTIVTITWPLRTSAGGCSGPVQQAPPGSYSAYAVDGQLISAAVPFRVS